MSFYNAYKSHLLWIDGLTTNVLQHAPKPGPKGDAFRADLAGLLSTAYVAAFECSIKAIFATFAKKRRNKIIQSMVGHHFDKINSKIHWQVLADNYAAQFGPAYRTAFLNSLNAEDQSTLQSDRVSIKETYANVLSWRHSFVHEGKKLSTLEEVTAAYPYARKVVAILDATMST